MAWIPVLNVVGFLIWMVEMCNVKMWKLAFLTNRRVFLNERRAVGPQWWPEYIRHVHSL